MNENKTIGTLADVLSLIDQTGLTGTRRRDMISAINRICEMAGTRPGERARGVARPEGDALSHSSGRPWGQRQELLEPKKPSGCCASACRRHRPVGPGSRNTLPGLGTAARSGRG